MTYFMNHSNREIGLHSRIGWMQQVHVSPVWMVLYVHLDWHKFQV